MPVLLLVAAMEDADGAGLLLGDEVVHDDVFQGKLWGGGLRGQIGHDMDVFPWAGHGDVKAASKATDAP